MKVMRYQIIKPLDVSWDEFGKVLRSIQKETRKVLNHTINLCWEYQGFSSEYKEVKGIYPVKREILNYSSMHGYAYSRC